MRVRGSVGRLGVRGRVAGVVSLVLIVVGASLFSGMDVGIPLGIWVVGVCVWNSSAPSGQICFGVWSHGFRFAPPVATFRCPFGAIAALEPI